MKPHREKEGDTEFENDIPLEDDCSDVVCIASMCEDGSNRDPCTCQCADGTL